MQRTPSGRLLENYLNRGLMAPAAGATVRPRRGREVSLGGSTPESPDGLKGPLPREPDGEHTERPASEVSSESGARTAEPVGRVQKAAAGMLPFVIIGLVVLYNLDISSRLRNLILLVLVIAIAVGLLVGFAWVKRTSTAVARVTVLVVLILAVSLTALVPIIFVGPSERILFIKLGAILILSVFPGLLYVDFIAVKAETLATEYVMHLHRLRIDTYENLPQPPRGSIFWRSGDPRRAEDDDDNLYRRKFDSLYGGTVRRPDGSVIRRQGGSLLPIVVTTVLLAVGWAVVLQPEPLPSSRLLFETFNLSGRPVLPAEPLRFGFLGAYLFILQMLIRRYFQEDLKTGAYISAAGRIVAVILLVTAVHQVWPSVWSETQETAFAFLVGIFPTIALKAIQALIAFPLRKLIPSLETKYPLSDLDGLNIWYESRLLEEGVEDMQNLATANLVDVMLRTRVPVDRLVDWVDQALLYLRVDPKDRDRLRRLGIRTATDLEDAFRPSFRPGHGGRREPDPVPKPERFAERLQSVLNEDNDRFPSVTYSLWKSLAREPNLYHVRQWKSYSWELERARDAAEGVRGEGERRSLPSDGAGATAPGEATEASVEVATSPSTAR